MKKESVFSSWKKRVNAIKGIDENDKPSQIKHTPSSAPTPVKPSSPMAISIDISDSDDSFPLQSIDMNTSKHHTIKNETSSALVPVTKKRKRSVMTTVRSPSPEKSKIKSDDRLLPDFSSSEDQSGSDVEANSVKRRRLVKLVDKKRKLVVKKERKLQVNTKKKVMKRRISDSFSSAEEEDFFVSSDESFNDGSDQEEYGSSDEENEDDEIPDTNHLNSDFREFFGWDESSDDEASQPVVDSIASVDSEPLASLKRRKTDAINKNGILPEGLQDDDGWLFDQKAQRFIYQLPSKSVFEIEEDIFNKLYGHQRDGLKWLVSRYCASEFRGGILADDMGLGKTIQVSAFINGVVKSDLGSRFLVVSPLSILHNWKNEITKWAPNIRRIIIFHNMTNNERDKLVKLFVSKSTEAIVMLTTYGTIRSQHQVFGDIISEHKLDSIILDEGHSIKNNKTKASNVLKEITSHSKFILTGTPIMNKLSEMWSLYDWIFDGELLGTKPEFKEKFEHPIVRSTKRDASAAAKQIGNQLSIELRETIQPYFLRREKQAVLRANNTGAVVKQGSSRAQISQKNELVVWIYLTPQQEEVYREFVGSSTVRAVLNKCESALGALNILRAICDHHIICTKCTKYGAIPDLDVSQNLTEERKRTMYQQHEDSCIRDRIISVAIEELIEESGKMKTIRQLLLQHRKNGDKTLIFSQYKRMLNVIERMLREDLRIKYDRIDGQITDAQERSRKVDRFNQDPSVSVFLLTTGCGSVGLTLTGANKVIIVDPSWNPAVDAQAVDRAYRIGQTKNVVVYRLITCSTIEEKIYRKQIFKFNLSKTAIEKENNYRYFSDAELQDLLTLQDPHFSATQKLLHGLHDTERKTYPELEEHINWLTNLEDVFGLSYHELLFQKAADDEFDSDDEAEHGMNKYLTKEKQMKLMEALQLLEKQRAQQLSSVDAGQSVSGSDSDKQEVMVVDSL